MRQEFLTNNETLLFWSSYEEHVSTKENMSSVDECSGYLVEDIVKIFRIDEAWNFEDVTEQCALAWLERNADRPSLMKTDGLGAWLEDSQALEDYIDGYDSSDNLSPHDERLGCHSQGVGRFGSYGA